MKKLQSNLFSIKNIVVSFIAIVLLILIILFYLSGKKKRTENSPVRTENNIPFRIDGELAFLDSLKKPVDRIFIEVADDEYERTQGLMYRKTMADSLGMLFIFPTSEPRGFWMKNTFISLDIIYVNEKLEIVSIQKYTKPFSEAHLPSIGNAMYVIEVNAGFCDARKIKEGQMIQFALKDKNIQA